LLGYLAACPREEDEAAAALARAGAARTFAGVLTSAASWTRRHGAWGALAILIVGGGAGIARYARPRASDTLRTPDVVGMSAAAARQMAESVGLEYREVGTRASEVVGAGGVLRQDPLPGMEVARGAVLKVVVSEGRSHVQVPDVTQMSVAQAQRNLEAAGLAGGTVQEAYSDRVPAGYVATTLPAPGARVVSGTAVDLVVSLGEERGGLAPPPPSPPDQKEGRRETLTYVVPAEWARQGPVKVVVELTDDGGRRVIYEGTHRAGDRIPPQEIIVKSATTARIYVEGKAQAERQYLP
jgi:serine/threonine-protein kinase